MSSTITTASATAAVVPKAASSTAATVAIDAVDTCMDPSSSSPSSAFLLGMVRAATGDDTIDTIQMEPYYCCVGDDGVGENDADTNSNACGGGGSAPCAATIADDDVCGWVEHFAHEQQQRSSAVQGRTRTAAPQSGMGSAMPSSSCCGEPPCPTIPLSSNGAAPPPPSLPSAPSSSHPLTSTSTPRARNHHHNHVAVVVVPTTARADDTTNQNDEYAVAPREGVDDVDVGGDDGGSGSDYGFDEEEEAEDQCEEEDEGEEYMYAEEEEEEEEEEDDADDDGDEEEEDDGTAMGAPAMSSRALSDPPLFMNNGGGGGEGSSEWVLDRIVSRRRRTDIPSSYSSPANNKQQPKKSAVAAAAPPSSSSLMMAHANTEDYDDYSHDDDDEDYEEEDDLHPWLYGCLWVGYDGGHDDGSGGGGGQSVTWETRATMVSVGCAEAVAAFDALCEARRAEHLRRVAAAKEERRQRKKSSAGAAAGDSGLGFRVKGAVPFPPAFYRRSSYNGASSSSPSCPFGFEDNPSLASDDDHCPAALLATLPASDSLSASSSSPLLPFDRVLAMFGPTPMAACERLLKGAGHAVYRYALMRNDKTAEAFLKKWEGLRGRYAPMLVYHGTRADNFLGIRAKSLLPGGTNGISMAHGSVYGSGVYCAPDLGTPCGYSGNGAAIMCLALVPKRKFTDDSDWESVVSKMPHSARATTPMARNDVLRVAHCNFLVFADHTLLLPLMVLQIGAGRGVDGMTRATRRARLTAEGLAAFSTTAPTATVSVSAPATTTTSAIPDPIASSPPPPPSVNTSSSFFSPSSRIIAVDAPAGAMLVEVVMGPTLVKLDVLAAAAAKGSFLGAVKGGMGVATVEGFWRRGDSGMRWRPEHGQRFICEAEEKKARETVGGFRQGRRGGRGGGGIRHRDLKGAPRRVKEMARKVLRK